MKYKWIVKIFDTAVSDEKFGWLCDCGRWTFGSDKDHVPIFSRIVGRVVHGRLKTCVRK